jgi:integrase/recombinase XerC
MFGSIKFPSRKNEHAALSAASFCRSSVFVAWCRTVTSAAQKATLEFIHLVDAWIAALSIAGRSLSTLDCYRRDVRQFREALVGIFGQAAIFDLEQIGQEEIDLVAITWQTEGASGQTVSRRFSAIKGFAAHLSLTANANCSRFLASTFPTATSGRAPAAEIEDVRALVASEDDSWIDLRNSAAFSTMACGLTTSETTGLNMTDVDIRRGVAVVRHTTLQPRPVPLSVDASGPIVRYLKAIPLLPEGDQPLFQTTRGTRLSARSLQAAFRMRRRVLGLSEAIVPSSLRHAAGRERAERWRSPAAVGRLLGIDAINTRRYFE